jgi:hypothetical protein
MNVTGPKLQSDRPDDTTHDFLLISDDRCVTKDVMQFDGLAGGMRNVPSLGRTVEFTLTHHHAARQ